MSSPGTPLPEGARQTSPAADPGSETGHVVRNWAGIKGGRVALFFVLMIRAATACPELAEGRGSGPGGNGRYTWKSSTTAMLVPSC